MEFATSISNEVKQYSSSKEYLHCIKEITRQTCDVEALAVEDVRAIIAVLNTLVNKKLDAEKGKKGRGNWLVFGLILTLTGKARAGAKVNVRGGGGGGGDFDDHKAGEFDDFLDFM